MKKIFTTMISALLLAGTFCAKADDVTYDLTIKLSPGNLEEVERGSKVVLTFGGVEVNNPYNIPVTATPQYDDENGEAETLRLNVDDEGNVYFLFDVIAEAGTQYKMQIRKGDITSADGLHSNMAKSWYYFVADAPEEEEGTVKLLSVDPVSGSTVKPGTTVNLLFSEEMDIDECTDAVTITDVNNEESVYHAVLDWNWDTFDFSNLQFIIPKTLPDGTYNMTIAADKLSGYESGEKYGEISLQYTVLADGGGSEPSEPTPVEVKNFTPAADEVQTLSNIINIGFKTQLASVTEGTFAVLKNNETEKTYTGVITVLENVEKTVKVDFDYGEDANSDNYLCVPGVYTLTIAAGSINGADGGTNAEITHNWTVKGVENLNDIEYVSVLPRNNATLLSLSSIKISYPTTPSLIKKSNAKIYVDDASYDFIIENNSLSVTISPAIEELSTTHTVTLPEGSIYSLETAHGNKAVTLTYRVDNPSAIDSIFAGENDNLTVYNCQGVCIMSNASSQDLRNLPIGLYIINGKKILIK